MDLPGSAASLGKTKNVGLSLSPFSVLIAVYKREKAAFLQLALQSLVKQSLLPNEIVLVQDGPLTQELDKVIADFKKQHAGLLKVLVFERNRGLGLALRDGVQACTHEYIVRMDSDDIALPDRFAEQMGYLALHPEIALLGSSVKTFSTDHHHPEYLRRMPTDHTEIVAYAKKRNPFCHMTVVFKKSAVLASGNYQDLPYFEDYDLWVRMIAGGYQTKNLTKTAVLVHEDEKTFARRSGPSYRRQEKRLQQIFLQSGFITLGEYWRNLLVRSLVRIVPNGVRIFVYHHWLREKVSV